MGIATAFFVLLLLFQSSYVFLFSLREGPGEMTLLALGVALAPVALLLGVSFVIRRRRRRGLILASGAVLLLSAMELILPVSPFKTTVTTHLQRRAVDAVAVTDVHDEPFVTGKGGAVGIRVSFEALFPRGGVLSVSPTLWAEDDSFRHYQTSMGHIARSAVEPEPPADGSGRYRFSPGGRHRFTVDFLPVFLSRPGGGGEEGGAALCVSVSDSGSLSAEEFLALIEKPLESVYRLDVVVRGNTTFSPARVAYTGESAGRYSLRTFHRNALAEGAAPCPW